MSVIWTLPDLHQVMNTPEGFVIDQAIERLGISTVYDDYAAGGLAQIKLGLYAASATDITDFDATGPHPGSRSFNAVAGDWPLGIRAEMALYDVENNGDERPERYVSDATDFAESEDAEIPEPASPSPADDYPVNLNSASLTRAAGKLLLLARVLPGDESAVAIHGGIQQSDYDRLDTVGNAETFGRVADFDDRIPVTQIEQLDPPSEWPDGHDPADCYEGECFRCGNDLFTVSIGGEPSGFYVESESSGQQMSIRRYGPDEDIISSDGETGVMCARCADGIFSNNSEQVVVYDGELFAFEASNGDFLRGRSDELEIAAPLDELARRDNDLYERIVDCPTTPDSSYFVRLNISEGAENADARREYVQSLVRGDVAPPEDMTVVIHRHETVGGPSYFVGAPEDDIDSAIRLSDQLEAVEQSGTTQAQLGEVFL